MKEDLIKILNVKLKQIKNNIDNLNELNEKIENEEKELKYVKDTIDVFKAEEHGFDIYKFSDISRETFNKLLMNLSDEVLTKFGTNSCNYDGLVYLINGINSGISLTLTQEQTDAINLFIDKLLEKEKNEQDQIESLNEEKQKLEVKDLGELNELDNKYSLIIDNIEEKKYVSQIDEVVEAINYSQVSNEKVFDILCYLLKYNSDIYKEKMLNKQEADLNEVSKINLSQSFDSESIEEKSFLSVESYDLEFEDSNDKFFDMENETSKELNEKNLENDNDIKIDDEESVVSEYNPVLPLESDVEEVSINSDYYVDDQMIDVVMPKIELDLPIEDNYDENSEISITNIPVDEYEDEPNEIDFNHQIEFETPVEFEENNNDEFENEENESDALEIDNTALESNESNITQLFMEYDLDITNIHDTEKDILLNGNVEEYKNIFVKLNEYDLLKYIKNNIDVIVQFLLYSNTKIIDDVMLIIKNDLSVDTKDSNVTSEILIKTMPSVFIDGEMGNYNNFVKNIYFLKNNGVDLINLFDFSREVLVADNDFIENNYKIVRDYDLTVNAYNAKYLLLLSNISSKIDYYVESMYKDNSENGNNEVFDGLEMIKLYPNKLNSVSSKTIQRLRYSSENNMKVFGSKEKSLAGEITNLNVDFINMKPEFVDSLFDNKFDIISKDEIEKYVQLISNDNYVELIEDETLNKLAGYRVGLRYYIGNINISANKVIRIYNILINEGIEKSKALLFAICYNSTITKTEYERIKSFVNSLGGN